MVVVAGHAGLPGSANAGAGVEPGLNQMNVRSRLLLEADGQVSNPFLLCVLISQRTRQLMMTTNASTSTAQLIDSALNELIAGALEFERVGRRRSPLVPAEV